MPKKAALKKGDVVYALTKQVLSPVQRIQLGIAEQVVISGVVEEKDEQSKNKFKVKWSIGQNSLVQSHGLRILKHKAEEVVPKATPTRPMVPADSGQKLPRKSIVPGQSVFTKAKNVLAESMAKRIRLSRGWQENTVEGEVIEVSGSTVLVKWFLPNDSFIEVACAPQVLSGLLVAESSEDEEEEESGSDGGDEDTAATAVQFREEDFSDGSDECEEEDDLEDVVVSRSSVSQDEEDNEVKEQGHSFGEEIKWTVGGVSVNKTDVYDSSKQVLFEFDKQDPVEILMEVQPDSTLWMDWLREKLGDVEKNEVYVFLALLLQISRVKLPMRDFWKKTDDDDGCFRQVFQMPNFRGIMSFSRFNSILQSLFGSPPSDEDVWDRPVAWLEAVSNGVRSRIRSYPSKQVTDESMVPFRGKTASKAAYMSGSLPPAHAPPNQRIVRKPQGVGYEIKTSAIPMQPGIGLITRYEIVSSPGPKFADRPPTVASILRLSQDFHGSGGTELADAGYGSVLACAELAHQGVYSVMCVKTISTGFPKKELTELLKTKKAGEWVSMTAVVNGVSMFALGWKIKEGYHSFYIASTSTTLEGSEARRLRWSKTDEEYVTLELTRPKTVELYHKFFNIIDRINKIRQNGFKLDRRPRNWRLRILLWGWSNVFTSVYSLWLYMNREQSSATKAGMSRNKFTDIMIKQLLLRGIVVRTVPPQIKGNGAHSIKMLKQHDFYKTRSLKPKLKCALCKRKSKAEYYCENCSKQSGKFPNNFHPLCGLCKEEHLREFS